MHTSSFDHPSAGQVAPSPDLDRSVTSDVPTCGAAATDFDSALPRGVSSNVYMTHRS